MRLLLVTPSLSRPGGVTRSVRRIVGSLRAEGHRVVVVSPDEALFPGDVREDGDDVSFGPGVRGGEDALARRGREHAAHLVATASRIADGADVVLGFYLTSGGVAAVEAARRLERPAVVFARGNDVDRDLVGGGAAAELVREAIAGAAHVVAVSTEMVAKIAAHTGVVATFVTNAVDRRVFFPDPEAGRRFVARAGLDPSRPRLGLFGELKAKRGLERLAAWPVEALAPFEILIVGHVRDDVRHLVPAGARVVPYLEDDDALRGAYAACAAVLQPSTSDGMPNVVLEAMACARPVIVSGAGGLADLVIDGVNGVVCDDPASWGRALERARRGELESLGPVARGRLPTPGHECDAILEVLQRATRR